MPYDASTTGSYYKYRDELLDKREKALDNPLSEGCIFNIMMNPRVRSDASKRPLPWFVHGVEKEGRHCGLIKPLTNNEDKHAKIQIMEDLYRCG